MNIVEINNLFKSYANKKAVNDLSFSVVRGEIMGLIGPNGAGKSTTIKTILDFIKPDSGEVAIFGAALTDDGKNKIGYLPEEKGLYKKLSAIDQILYLASLKGMDRKAAEKKAHELLEKCDMLANKKMKIEEMSKGMGQMIQFIITIIHDPELIILDEPFSGLDPINRNLLKSILAGLKDQGKTMLLSTHQMNEIEELCDRVLMINKGRSVLYGDLPEIKSAHRGHSVYLDVEGTIDKLAGVVAKRPYKDIHELILDKDTTPQQVLEQLVKQGKMVKRFEIATPSLNEIFLKIVDEQDEQQKG
ncbi:MAG: ATP-binding cassette domain-containing protein [bacterium]|nr:ATP-binding cassette domain-containing protein [bacterium]